MKQNAFLCMLGCLLTLAAGVSRADEQVGTAAADPSTIAGLVAKMAPDQVSGFGGQVIEAAARMPLAPERRVTQIALALQALFVATPMDQRDELLAVGLSKVPFRMLPALVDAAVQPIGKALADLDAKAYAAFVAAVVQDIGALDLESDDKSVITTFALVLLKRAAKPEIADEALRAGLAAVPEMYAAAVQAAIPSALVGDYTGVLGPAAAQSIVTVPVVFADPTIEVGGLTTLTTVDRSDDESIYIDVGLERPSVEIREEGSSPSPTRPSPPTPPPYQAQF